MIFKKLIFLFILFISAAYSFACSVCAFSKGKEMVVGKNLDWFCDLPTSFTNMIRLSIVVLFLSIYSPAQGQASDGSKAVIQAAQSWADVDYVGDNIIGHKLDIYLPREGKGPFPVVICIYGSAWFSNNSKASTFSSGMGQRLLQTGFAVVSINHRSSSDAKFPAQIHDVKAAIRFIKGNSASYSLDSNFVGITGWSSGGHLSALAGTSNGVRIATINKINLDIEGNLGHFRNSSSHVDAVVDWFGPTDFLIMDSCGSTLKHNPANSPESSLIGGAIQENKEKVAFTNPINYIDRSDPAFLIFHGDKDPLVPLCESEKLMGSLQHAGVKAELIIVPDGGHGNGVMIDKYYDRMIDFFKNELKTKRK